MQEQSPWEASRRWNAINVQVVNLAFAGSREGTVIVSITGRKAEHGYRQKEGWSTGW